MSPNGLKALRGREKWTHQRAADAMGVSRSGFIKLERSERKLSLDHVKRAKQVFNATDEEVRGELPIRPRDPAVVDPPPTTPARILIALLTGTFQASGIEGGLARELASAAVAAAYNPTGDISNLSDTDWIETGRRLVQLLAGPIP